VHKGGKEVARPEPSRNLEYEYAWYACVRVWGSNEWTRHAAGPTRCHKGPKEDGQIIWHSHSGLRNTPYSRMQKWLQRHAAVAKWSMAGRKQTLSASRRATDAGRRRVGALHGPLGPERVEDVEHVVNP